MPSLALRLEVEAAAAEALSDALLEAGAQSISIESPDGPRSALSALFGEGGDPAATLRIALEACGQSPDIRYTVETVPDDDWVRRSQSQFTPIALERLWIGASWHRPPANAKLVVRIDPGLAFGTGSHPTTKLVLRFLERTLRGGERVLDYGCGSGVLAIAATKLGASQVAAVDIDPQAVSVTDENSRANRANLRAYHPEALPPGRYDVIVANILAQPLIDLAALLSAHAEQGTRLALAGILESQAAEVAKAYAAHFEMNVAERDEGWALLVGVGR
ncbi:MAG TPA: 50S ribosomal protein L11 methyltransferase [Burkholderiales bacterium]|jgi:ribosomal protein L11 methyltransferase|nr:50S ribosomal protein L11 methyltransferase [Burkholderiales bacterium]